MIRCLHCHAETTNGLALCDLCRLYATGVLEVLPIQFANLSRWRPGRTGTSRPMPGSVVLYDGASRGSGTGDRISDRLDEANNMLTTRARELVDDRPHLARLVDRLAHARASEVITEAESVAWLCKGFARYLTSVSTLGWAGDFVRDLTKHGDALQALMALVPGWYAGGCRQVIGFDEQGAAVRCETPTYVTPGISWVTCTQPVVVVDDDGKRQTVDIGCGATTYARDHLDVVLDEARGWIDRPKALAEAIVTLVDTETSVPRLYDRIRWWASNGDIDAIRQIARGYSWDEDEKRMVVIDEEVGHARYRMGDVLDLVLRDTRSIKASRVS